MPMYDIKKIKLYLVFFCLNSLLISCEGNRTTTAVQVHYENGKAVSVEFTYDKDIDNLGLFLKKELKIPVLGSLVNVGSNKYSFIPVIPFTDGQTYSLRAGKRTIGSFTVSDNLNKTVPEILDIYPNTDTVPENLLKMYFRFSQPMQEVGHVLDFIKVVDETEGAVKEIFLEMESELWNKRHDLLTLWLDPGRIKTDLIPNRERGMPILKGHHYTIHIDSNWRSAEGLPLKHPYKKTLIVTQRDTKKPAIKNWTIDLPNADSRQPLSLLFSEPMDAVLSSEAIVIYDGSGNRLPGDLEVVKGEKKILFTPKNNWKTESYKIIVEAILEDLAGNNLNRLFDENISVKSKNNISLNAHALDFKID
ncbi:Ig-like domain-containing protein [uncultured Kriegella sp.]|uniref:Ig-like domain-containing protein n=1 Tax=uncultured Kriegella sp. TaxID=1798910 RepID=UPI0030D8F343